MQNKRIELPSGLIDMIVRASGWQAVTGAKTILRVYARQVIDQHMDLYCMSLDFQHTAADWDRKLKACVGFPVLSNVWQRLMLGMMEVVCNCMC